MSKIITLDGLRDYLTDLKRLFVTKTDAESTYETKANAANIYETKEDAATHLTKTEASETYITKTDASNTYATKTDASNTYATEEQMDAQSILKRWPDGAEAHNAMWGGRDITAAFDSGEFSEHVADGTFRDIFPGDYITKQVTIPQVLADDGTTVLFAGGTYTVNWVIADCDYWWHKGDKNNGMETHHVVIVPQTPIFKTRMNATSTTKDGYEGSEMYRETIPACATGIVNAFGSSHILTFRDGISNILDTSHVSSGITRWTGTPGWWGTWVSVQCNLMSEKMVYGAPICSAGAMDNTMATRQMSAFHLSEKLINYNRNIWWLRDVVSNQNFAVVFDQGFANAHWAKLSFGVRPFALLA